MNTTQSIDGLNKQTDRPSGLPNWTDRHTKQTNRRINLTVRKTNWMGNQSAELHIDRVTKLTYQADQPDLQTDQLDR